MLNSALWLTGEVAAAHVAPFGPVMVRTAYLSKQVLAAAAGMADGKGFNLKVSTPDLSELNSSVLPPGFQLVAAVRLGERVPRRDGGVDVTAEIQIFKHWFDQVDVDEVREPQGRPFPSWDGASVSAEPAPDDRWAVWLDLLGEKLIHDLAKTLAQAPRAGVVYAMKIDLVEQRP